VNLKYLFTIEKTERMGSRGVFAYRGVGLEDCRSLRPGQPVLLLRPDGSRVATTLVGIADPVAAVWPSPAPRWSGRRFFVVLPSALDDEDFAEGTQVWRVDPGEE
jgi:hypothetical protein